MNTYPNATEEPTVNKATTQYPYRKPASNQRNAERVLRKADGSILMFPYKAAK